MGQRGDTSKTLHEVFLEVTADREAEYPCPVCGLLCKAHDFQEFTWHHLNLFQHHCYVTARLPRVNCPDHGIKRVKAPWDREGSRFTLLFEQVAMTLVREMPVLAERRSCWSFSIMYLKPCLSRPRRFLVGNLQSVKYNSAVSCIEQPIFFSF